MMKRLGFMGLLELLTILATLKPSYFQDVQSPCPDVFQYDYDQNTQQLYGTIQIFPPDENFIHLKVELSLGNAVRGYQGSIEVPYTKNEVISVIMERKPLKYKVYFPAWNQIPPKITKISVNDRIFCYGPKVPFNSAPVITTIYLEHTLKLNVAPLSASPAFSNNKPFQANSNNNNINNNNNKNENWQYELDEQDIRIIPSTNNNNNNNWQNPFNFNPPVTQKINYDRPNTPSPTVPVNNAYPENPFFSSDTSVNKPPQAEKNNPSKVTTSNRNVTNTFPTNPTPNRPQSKPPTVSRPVTERAQTDIAPQDSGSSQNKPSQSSLQRPNSDLCGVPVATNSLVVNGDAVRKGAFPWLVALYHATNEGLLYKCCASLVTNSHVVTAAHCVYRKSAVDIILRIGRSNIKEWIPDPNEKYMIAQSVTVHPEYRSLSSNADIAVLKFRTEIEFSKFIRPICLWQGSTDLANVVNQQGVVVGWGKDENGVPRTAEPRQVTLPIVSQEQCLRAAYQFRDITSNTTFCAGSLNGKGPCNGDSGSGFIMKRGDRWFLRGIVSIALPSETNLCDLKNYIVFADASKYNKWLLDNLV